MQTDERKWVRLAMLKDLGWIKIHLGEGLSGARLWYIRTGDSLDILRQRDEATKHQDLTDTGATVPADTPAGNRQWAIDLANDALTDWQG